MSSSKSSTGSFRFSKARDLATGEFQCDRCGLCCRLIGGIPQLVAFDRGDGVCCHLTEDNLCDIYDSRPEICSVEGMYVHFATHMSKEEYLDLMTKSCQLIKERFDILCAGQTARERVKKRRNQHVAWRMGHN